MELFEGATLLDLRHDIDASKIFGRMTKDELQSCLQDIVHLGSCLLPLGLQQTDTAARNIFVRFNSTSGYLGMSWIDIESMQPVQGDTYAKESLDRYARRLLKETDSYRAKKFLLPSNAMTSRSAYVNPNRRFEKNLALLA